MLYLTSVIADTSLISFLLNWQARRIKLQFIGGFNRLKMLLKLLLFIGAVALASAQDEPKRLYKHHDDGDDLQLISRFNDPFDGILYRLPNETVPTHYDIMLWTDVHRGDFGFSGRVTIYIRAITNTPTITVHYRLLTILNITLQNSVGAQIQPNVPHNFRENLEFIDITPMTPLTAGQSYRVVIHYEGVLRTDDAGFYRSSYINEQGYRTWLATTQFESTDARHAFPW